ncbi:MAG: CRTAC1 family protein, partial [Cyclobacteriaceae bacterium]|nr:CRTAC1 family protein [Cyclobacteriaceae bacterium]
GRFSESPDQNGLSNTAGLWNTLKAADLDNDGNTDIILGNHGQNTRMKATQERPLTMYVYDFDMNGTIEQVITTYNGEKDYPLPLRNDMVAQIPNLQGQYPKHEDYQGKQINDIFPQMNGVLKTQVYETRSIILKNKGNLTFEVLPLPVQVQYGPVHAIQVADINHDGLPDVITGGNQYRAKPQTGIYAAGYPEVLINQGNCRFQSLPITISGLLEDEEIRNLQFTTVNQSKLLILGLNNQKLKVYQYD